MLANNFLFFNYYDGHSLYVINDITAVHKQIVESNFTSAICYQNIIEFTERIFTLNRTQLFTVIRHPKKFEEKSEKSIYPFVNNNINCQQRRGSKKVFDLNGFHCFRSQLKNVINFEKVECCANNN